MVPGVFAFDVGFLLGFVTVRFVEGSFAAVVLGVLGFGVEGRSVLVAVSGVSVEPAGGAGGAAGGGAGEAAGGGVSGGVSGVGGGATGLAAENANSCCGGLWAMSSRSRQRTTMPRSTAASVSFKPVCWI